jgi:DNA-binding NtrC family response regulator
MLAIHTLIDLLDSSRAVAALESSLKSWALQLSPSCEVVIDRSAAKEDSRTVSERSVDGRTALTVPAPTDDGGVLVFTTTAPSERLGDSFRRLLVVAGRLFGSSLASLRRSEIAEGEAASLRELSFGSAHDFLGQSDGAKQLAAQIPKLAASDVTLLVEGETGVGKSFVARLVHEQGPRAKEPLRIFNCASLPENLFESELFGHEKGAFTGATVARHGAFEAVGGGTLFLDEVGELSLPNQAKLLRVLEERKFERLGSNRSIDMRARVICATNRDLEQMVATGLFRRDLLFRIAVVRVRVPPLRERVVDIPKLADHMLFDAARSTSRRVRGFAPGALEAICAYSWPGNVRELRNAIEHAVALGEGGLVTAGDLPPMVGAIPQPTEVDLVRLPLDMETLERRAIGAALRASSGNRNRACALLGMTRSTLYNKLKEYGLS